jgi:hypothetical protein
LRYSLLPKWAVADPRAAMDFANAIQSQRASPDDFVRPARLGEEDPRGGGLNPEVPRADSQQKRPRPRADAGGERPRAAFAPLRFGKSDHGLVMAFHEVRHLGLNDPAAAAAKAGKSRTASNASSHKASAAGPGKTPSARRAKALPMAAPFERPQCGAAERQRSKAAADTVLGCRGPVAQQRHRSARKPVGATI